MFGIKTSLPPGKAAAHEIFLGFAAMESSEKELVAELLVRIAPGLAAQGAHAQGLPMGKIIQTLKKAFWAAWTGLRSPTKLAETLVKALETEPEGAELRTFTAAVAERVAAAVAPPAQGDKTP